MDNLLSTLKLAKRVKLSKEYVTQNEASRADLNVDKRIFELPPFMHRVYFTLYLKNTVKTCAIEPQNSKI